jgi:hypothetical protein
MTLLETRFDIFCHLPPSSSIPSNRLPGAVTPIPGTLGRAFLAPKNIYRRDAEKGGSQFSVVSLHSNAPVFRGVSTEELKTEN